MCETRKGPEILTDINLFDNVFVGRVSFFVQAEEGDGGLSFLFLFEVFEGFQGSRLPGFEVFRGFEVWRVSKFFGIVEFRFGLI